MGVDVRKTMRLYLTYICTNCGAKIEDEFTVIVPDNAWLDISAQDGVIRSSPVDTHGFKLRILCGDDEQSELIVRYIVPMIPHNCRVNVCGAAVFHNAALLPATQITEEQLADRIYAALAGHTRNESDFRILAVFEDLSSVAQYILTARYGYDLPLKDIEMALDLTHSKIEAEENRTLRYIRMKGFTPISALAPSSKLVDCLFKGDVLSVEEVLKLDSEALNGLSDMSATLREELLLKMDTAGHGIWVGGVRL